MARQAAKSTEGHSALLLVRICICFLICNGMQWFGRRVSASSIHAAPSTVLPSPSFDFPGTTGRGNGVFVNWHQDLTQSIEFMNRLPLSRITGIEVGLVIIVWSAIGRKVAGRGRDEDVSHPGRLGHTALLFTCFNTAEWGTRDRSLLCALYET